MNLEGIVSIGKNEYIVNEMRNFEILSLFAYIGSKAYCLETEKMYVFMDIDKWVSI